MWYEWGYCVESCGYDWSDGYGEQHGYDGWQKRATTSSNYTGSMNVDPLAAATQMATLSAAAGTHYSPVAPTSVAVRSATNPTKGARFSLANTGLQGKLSSGQYGSDQFPTEDLLLDSEQSGVPAQRTTCRSAPSSHYPRTKLRNEPRSLGTP